MNENIYWDIVKDIPSNEIAWKFDHTWHPDSFLGEIDRHTLCRSYTWAIPDPDSVEFVARHLHPRAVEMGAGTGYWAAQMERLGDDIIAYDIAPPDRFTNNEYHSDRDAEGRFVEEFRYTYHEVLEGDPSVLVRYQDRTLFLSWPPMSDMAYDCLRYYAGNKLVYIGEGSGGCTANDDFFTELEENWCEIEEHQGAQWYGIHDYITVYERKRV